MTLTLAASAAKSERVAVMKILVAIKQVPDPETPLRVRRDGSGMESDGVREVINPFDAIALEGALRLREAGRAREVVAVSVGPALWREGLSTALAMGADRALLAESDQPLEPLSVAKVLAAMVAREGPDLLLTGKQGVDGDLGQTGAMLAGLLGWPQAECAYRIDWLDEGMLRVTREVDGGLEVLEVDLPALISADLRLNTPRFVTLPNIMLARKKPLETLPVAALGIDLARRLKPLSWSDPPRRPPGVHVADAAELLRRLRQEARVIR